MIWCFKYGRVSFSAPGSLSHHHSDELFVVDVTITVEIRLTDHLSDILVGELLTKGDHGVSKLSGWDKTIAITIEDLEGLNELPLLLLLLGFGVLNLLGHELEESGDINVKLPISVLMLSEIILSDFMTKGIHEGDEVLGGGD